MEGSEDRIAAPARWASVPRPCGRHRDPCPRRCGARSLRPCRPQWPDPSDQRLSQPEPGAIRTGCTAPTARACRWLPARTACRSARTGSMASPAPGWAALDVGCHFRRGRIARCGRLHHAGLGRAAVPGRPRAWVAGWTWATRPARTVAPRLDSAASTRGCRDAFNASKMGRLYAEFRVVCDQLKPRAWMQDRQGAPATRAPCSDRTNAGPGRIGGFQTARG